MAKKIYVNGGIVIKTPYFRAIEAGAYYNSPPEGAEIIEPNKEDEDGYKYIEISEKHPQSIFNEYYAKYGFSSYCMGAPFLYKNYADVYEDYVLRINSIKEIINLDIESEKHRDILYRMFYLNIVTSLETFVSDIIITKITSSPDAMQAHVKHLSQSEQDELAKLHGAFWEQKLIMLAMRKAYNRIDTIKNDMKSHFNVSIINTNGKIGNHIKHRNLLAHKNGRRKDNTYFTPNKGDILELIDDTNLFVKQIYKKIK